MSGAGSPGRRALVRQYKETGPVAGVYAIRNLPEGKLLVASAMNLAGALNRERFELRLRTHRNRALQADWDRLGDAAFVFEPLQELKRRDDPAFDPRAELADLLSLWREELLGDPEASGYRLPAA